MGSDKEWWSINITVWHTVVQEVGGKLLLFYVGLPIYQSGFIKVWDLSSFHNILHHRSVLNPSYKTDLNDLVTTWLLSDQLQCNSILLAYELPTFLKNVYKSCIGACENKTCSSWLLRDQSQIKMFLCQDNRKERNKASSLTAFVEMLKLLLMGDIQFQVSKTNCSKTPDEGEEGIFLLNPSNLKSGPWWRPNSTK